MTSHARKVLVVAPNWLGDAVMSLPVVGLFGAVQSVHTTLVTNPYTERVYRGVDGVDELVVLPKDGHSRRVWSRARALREAGYAAAVLLTPSFSSALTVALSGIPARVGYAADARGFLLSSSLSSKGLREEHLSDNYLRLARRTLESMGVAPPGVWSRPAVRVFDDERTAVAALVKGAGIGGAYAVVVPGAVFGATKKWPADKFRALVAGLAGAIDVILTGTDGDRGLCDEIAGGRGRVHNLAGRTDLGQFFALLAGASVVVANDSGAPHVSASLGVPTAVIFGSTSPTWTKPLGQTVEVVREPVHCSPCFRSQCPTQLECFAGIAVDRVADVAAALIDNAPTVRA